MPTVGERGSRGSCRAPSGVFSTTIGVRQISLVGERGSNESIRFIWSGLGGGGGESEVVGTSSWLFVVPMVLNMLIQSEIKWKFIPFKVCIQGCK